MNRAAAAGLDRTASSRFQANTQTLADDGSEGSEGDLATLAGGFNLMPYRSLLRLQSRRRWRLEVGCAALLGLALAATLALNQMRALPGLERQRGALQRESARLAARALAYAKTLQQIKQEDAGRVQEAVLQAEAASVPAMLDALSEAANGVTLTQVNYLPGAGMVEGVATDQGSLDRWTVALTQSRTAPRSEPGFDLGFEPGSGLIESVEIEALQAHRVEPAKPAEPAELQSSPRGADSGVRFSARLVLRDFNLSHE